MHPGMKDQCPRDETMARFATGAATVDERARLAAHVDRCPACLAHVAALAAGSLQSFVARDVNTGPTESLHACSVACAHRDVASAALEPRPGDRLGRFVVGRTLGRGGMGVVVAAHDPELDRPIAI